jgi:hypothetical protein
MAGVGPEHQLVKGRASLVLPLILTCLTHICWPPELVLPLLHERLQAQGASRGKLGGHGGRQPGNKPKYAYQAGISPADGVTTTKPGSIHVMVCVYGCSLHTTRAALLPDRSASCLPHLHSRVWLRGVLMLGHPPLVHADDGEAQVHA